VVKVRLDRKATSISVLIAPGIQRDGQKRVLAIRNMGRESEAAWRAVLDDLTSRVLARPDLVIVDGGKGLEAALASLRDDVPVPRCTVHKERNLLVIRNATCWPTRRSTCTTRSRPSSTT
jgi:putative transposase